MQWRERDWEIRQFNFPICFIKARSIILVRLSEASPSRIDEFWAKEKTIILPSRNVVDKIQIKPSSGFLF
ncbi:hypothetical protein BG60_03540 [Caballeronia zhejiangensis]|uniref:Uncharacterized protein n=1 Tax=Caballeronia zhejiangensis TaxID=871203 RepID=A0A656QVS2_9BURK|nr:hypothetical protein BG60_03540 [Caballeronia zhejiangensis]